MCTQIRPPIIWAVLSGSTLFDQDASKTFQQTTKADNNFVIAAKELKKWVQFIYSQQIMKCY